MSKIVLIDGHSILNRAFYGMPDLTNAKGVHTGAVYGFLSILFHILDEEKPEYLEVAFDVHAPTFRHKAFAGYKGTRHPMPDELREQVPLIKKVLHAMGVVTVEEAGLEADDILGTLAKKAQAQGMEVSLVSGDRDLLQIADEHIRIRIPKTKKGQTVIEDYYADDVVKALQVTPQEFIQVKALQGDTADNIPGVPKVGPKTATDLIVRYHTVQGVYDHLDEIKRNALRETLAANKEQAEMSLFLATIKTDTDVSPDLEHARIGNLYTPEAFSLYTELGFKNFLGRFDQDAMNRAQEGTAPGGEEKTPDAEIITDLAQANKFFNSVNNNENIAVFPVLDAPKLAEQPALLGLAVAVRARTAYFPCAREQSAAQAPVQMTLDFGDENSENPNQSITAGNQKGNASSAVKNAVTQEYLCGKLMEIRKRIGAGRSTQDGESTPDPAAHAEGNVFVFNIKDQYSFWGIAGDEFDSGIHLEGIKDLLIEVYLLNPLKSDYQPQDIASEYLGETLIGQKELLGKESFAKKCAEDLKAVAEYACRSARALLKAGPLIGEKLQEEEMEDLYEKIELPISYILYDMQRIGMRILPGKLKDYGDQLTNRINELEQMIHEEAGCDFNIASPKQLGEILFEQMHLPFAKKTKTGYSTAADVLEKLAPDYPIVAHILKYRALTKLKSTYADGLSAYIARDSRIHTVFHQTITATGRLSSSDPNLQNIPMRTELGRSIRKVFVPEEGWSFTDSDYSQIELRILASLSGDPALIEAFRENRDIHRTTASKVFHVPFDQVTDQQRRDAKAVNFGIVYGISSFGLSQNLSISRKQAGDYIKEYFAMFPGIKIYLDGLVSKAKENGYSTTLFGRRRPVPELKSSNFMQRQFGERVAMNAPIQGTGADIMKAAMIRVWERLKREHLQSRLILQIHDELLVETAPGEEEKAAKILKEGMMGAADLAVPLEVDCHSGKDWYEAK